MAAPASSIITRVAYGVSQLPRVAWYLGHGLALRRLAEAARQSNEVKARRRVRSKAPVPDRSRLYADMARLFLQDLANVESGLYPLPADHDGSLLTLINRSRLFFADLPEIHRRREGRAHNEIFNKDTRGTRPRYYLQNFHFQSGGWLNPLSAMTPRSRSCSTEPPMRCGARRCRSSMSYLPDAISANCGFLISAVAPGAFSISSSRPGRA
jgi:hypothetical protein